MGRDPRSRVMAANARRNRLVAIAFVAPAMILILGILYIPALYGGYFSMHELDALNMGDFIGLETYRRVLSSPGLGAIVIRTVVFTLGAVIVTLVLSLAVSAWLDRLPRRLMWPVLMLVVVPWVISTVVGALLFRWTFLEPIGLGYYVLSILGIEAPNILGDPILAMVALIAVAVWRSWGFAVILLLAGLRGVPSEIRESASIDGATGFQTFRHIVLPMIKTPLVLTTIVLALSNLNNVENPLVTTGGGPASATLIMPLEIYLRGFSQFDFGGSTSLAVLMFVANTILVVGYVRLTKWEM